MLPKGLVYLMGIMETRVVLGGTDFFTLLIFTIIS